MKKKSAEGSDQTSDFLAKRRVWLSAGRLRSFKVSCKGVVANRCACARLGLELTLIAVDYVDGCR